MTSIFKWLGNIGLLVACVFALFCLLARVFWGFELFTHYQAYWALDALVVALLFGVAKCPRRAVGAVLLALFFSWRFVPYYFPKAEPGEGERAARVLHYNVLHSNEEYAQVRDFLVAQDADIVVVQEFNPDWQRELQAFIASYPHKLLQPERGASGMALLSRFPLEDASWGPINPDGWPVIRALVKTPAGDLDLLAIHPPPPVRQRSARARNGCLKAVPAHEAKAAARLVVGDFNCTPWSPHFRDLIRDAKLLDSSLGRGVTSTWNLSASVSIPIDHVLHSEEVEVLSREVGPSLGSDHRAVTVDLSF